MSSRHRGASILKNDNMGAERWVNISRQINTVNLLSLQSKRTQMLLKKKETSQQLIFQYTRLPQNKSSAYCCATVLRDSVEAELTQTQVRREREENKQTEKEGNKGRQDRDLTTVSSLQPTSCVLHRCQSVINTVTNQPVNQLLA